MTRSNRELAPVEPDEKPPVRLLPESLDDRAFLAALLGPGPGDAADLSELARVADLDVDRVRVLPMTREFAVRLARSDAVRRPVITSWTELQAYVRVAMAHLPTEQFRVLYLDHRNNLMVDEFLAEGTVNHAPVYPREVVRRALEISASAMVLVHNHPSGDPTPSRADIDMTRQVIDAARCLGLQVHDHLIVGRDGASSFRALGLM